MNQSQFEAWWPEVSRRLNATLTRRGVRAADAADIVQETAVRTLAHWPGVDDSEALLRWAQTVAWRQCIDAHRRTRGATTVSFEAAHDRASPDRLNSERVVEGRLELERTLRAMSSLSSTDRTALTAALTGAATAADRKSAIREAVRLHRARLRLLGIVGKVSAAFTVSWKSLRKLVTMEGGRVAGTAVTAAVIVGAFALYDLPQLDLGDTETAPSVAAVVDGQEPATPPTTTSTMTAAAAPTRPAPVQAAPQAEPQGSRPPPADMDIIVVPPPPPPPVIYWYDGTLGMGGRIGDGEHWVPDLLRACGAGPTAAVATRPCTQVL